MNKLVLYLLKLTDAKAASKCVVTIVFADAPIYHTFAPFLLQLHYIFPNSYITKIHSFVHTLVLMLHVFV